MDIKNNMGTLDRTLRLLGSLALLYVGFINTGLIGNTMVNVLLGGFGIANIIFAITGSCPVYTLAHISTAGKDSTGAK